MDHHLFGICALYSLNTVKLRKIIRSLSLLLQIKQTENCKVQKTLTTAKNHQITHLETLLTSKDSIRQAIIPCHWEERRHNNLPMSYSIQQAIIPCHWEQRRYNHLTMSYSIRQAIIPCHWEERRHNNQLSLDKTQEEVEEKELMLIIVCILTDPNVLSQKKSNIPSFVSENT